MRGHTGSTPEVFAARNGPEYIRWVQESLNRILGLRLAVDGRLGRHTRSAIRSFQARQGLVVDGVVGPNTERALKASVAGGAAATPAATCSNSQSIAHFAKGKTSVEESHREAYRSFVERIARCVSDSRRTSARIESIAVMGHASSEGDTPLNVKLGQSRALKVARDLQAALKSRKITAAIDPRTLVSGVVTITTRTLGESRPIASNDTEPGRKKNRRVEVLLPIVTSTAPRCCIRFLPSAHGFRFNNAFSVVPPSLAAIFRRLGIPPGVGGIGLCGGMIFLAADLFLAGRPPPAVTTVPAIGEALFNRVADRQLDSLLLRTFSSRFAAPVRRFLRMMRAPAHGPGGTAEETARELMRVRTALCEQRPVVLGLVLASSTSVAGAVTGLTENHQVLVFCVVEHTPARVDLLIYDPNHSGRDDLRIEVTRRTIAGRVEATAEEIIPATSGSRGRRIPIPKGLFVMPYTFVAP